MKHWTEPHGIFLIQIPVHWQYKDVSTEENPEKPPYSFEPYEDAVGCFQISCYPLAEPTKIELSTFSYTAIGKSNWKTSRMDAPEFNMRLYFCSLGDQLLTAKYIYRPELENDERIAKELRLVERTLNSLTIVPDHDRRHAANLDKHDQFLSALAATYDLLDNAIRNDSYIEAIVLSASQIDAFLRLSIVLSRQIRDHTDEIDVKYFHQGDNEGGISEREIYKKAFREGIIQNSVFERLESLYKLRNRVIHRFVISKIKTRDVFFILGDYLQIAEETRLILRELEEKEYGQDFGIYGHGFSRDDVLGPNEIRRLKAMANDKHLMKPFKHLIEGGET